ncbi:MAG: hypothetical protein Q4E63_01885 [Prevotellaceae bacterium]|nr:hypothetical protein [Prevotellaceae bacterium]
MSKQKPYLTYAINAEGYLTHVDAVSKGLSCACICPHCHNKLCAKNGGNNKVHHFAHKDGSDCVGAVESALHMMAKEILQENKKVMLPSVYNKNQNGVKTEFSQVKVEPNDKELKLRPDCIGYTNDGKEIWVEFKRTHQVDAKKAGKIISAKKDCIEIDLNKSELDPVSLQKFIENEVAHRKWIYNSQCPPTQYSDNETHRCDDYNNDSSSHIRRHLAMDDTGNIVSLYNLSEINTLEHTYYCMACGKEVFIDVDDYGQYSFEHLSDNEQCMDDYYLYEAAKKILYQKFNTANKFEIEVPKVMKCEEQSNCKLPSSYTQYCSKPVSRRYDLKQLGYNNCSIDYMFPNADYRCDIVLFRGEDIDTSIIISIMTEDCYVDVTSMHKRTIEVRVDYESDVYRLQNQSLDKINVKMYNFHKSLPDGAHKEDINNPLLAFTLFVSGKYSIGTISCHTPKERSAVYKIMFFSGLEDSYKLKQFAIYKCYKAHRTVCICELCSFLKIPSSYLSHKVCIRYKTKGTQHYPLKTKPINCPWFEYNEGMEMIFQEFENKIEFIEHTF